MMVQLPYGMGVASLVTLPLNSRAPGAHAGLSRLLANSMGLQLRLAPAPALAAAEGWGAPGSVLRLEVLEAGPAAGAAAGAAAAPRGQLRPGRAASPAAAAAAAAAQPGGLLLGTVYLYLDPACVLPFTCMVRHAPEAPAPAAAAPAPSAPARPSVDGPGASGSGQAAGAALPPCAALHLPAALVSRGAERGGGAAAQLRRQRQQRLRQRGPDGQPRPRLEPEPSTEPSTPPPLLLESVSLLRTLLHELGHALNYVLSARWVRGGVGADGRQRGDNPEAALGSAGCPLQAAAWPAACAHSSICGISTTLHRGGSGGNSPHKRCCLLCNAYGGRMGGGAGLFVARRPTCLNAVQPAEPPCLLLAWRPVRRASSARPEDCACYSPTDHAEMASHVLERWAADPRVVSELSCHADRRVVWLLLARRWKGVRRSG